MAAELETYEQFLMILSGSLESLEDEQDAAIQAQAEKVRAAYAARLRASTPKQLKRLVYALTGMRIPDRRVCPNHCSPFRAFAEAYFGLYPMSVWKGSRGLAGKTTLLALLGHMEAVALGANVVILGGSGEQSQRVHENQDAFWQYNEAPHDLIASRSKTRTRLTNGAQIIAITASQRSVRGPHPQRLRIDEADELDLNIFDSAMGQTMARGGINAQTVVSSTHQYADGTMSEVLKRATARGWPVRQWCWRETIKSNHGGWLDPSEVERKRGEMTEDMWNTEVELGDPDPSVKAIDPDAVEAMFNSERGVWEVPKAGERQYIIVEEPTKGGQYAVGADWAKEQDSTIIIVFRVDVKPYRLVAFSRDRKRPWPTMLAEFDKLIKLYRMNNEASVVAAHDNTGIGDVLDDYRDEEATGVYLTGRRRSDILSGYIVAIEQNSFTAPRIHYMYGEHSTATGSNIYGNKHLPDTICAGAMALWAHDNIKRKRRRVVAPLSIGKTSASGGRDNTG